LKFLMAEAKRWEVEWPVGGEILFTIGDDHWNNAMLRVPEATFSTVAEGMYLSAKLTVEHVNRTGTHQDFLIYPAAFCYRQFIELAMKDILRNGKQLLQEPGDYLQSHDLKPLWEGVRPILEKVWPEGPKKDLNNVWAIIKQFHDVDPKSDAFRFPEGKKGEKPLKHISHINLRILGSVMEKLYNFFGGCMMGIDEYLSAQREAESDAREYDSRE
jgi:hypothetical protein